MFTKDTSKNAHKQKKKETTYVTNSRRNKVEYSRTVEGHPAGKRKLWAKDHDITAAWKGHMPLVE